jgi:hypothetical protein
MSIFSQIVWKFRKKPPNGFVETFCRNNGISVSKYWKQMEKDAPKIRQEVESKISFKNGGGAVSILL